MVANAGPPKAQRLPSSPELKNCRSERKGKEGKGKAGKGKERQGRKEGKARESKGKEGKGRERKGKEGKGRKERRKGVHVSRQPVLYACGAHITGG